jgi:hypothetical protein
MAVFKHVSHETYRIFKSKRRRTTFGTLASPALIVHRIAENRTKRFGVVEVYLKFFFGFQVRKFQEKAIIPFPDF